MTLSPGKIAQPEAGGWVGLGVIADKLINIGRHLAASDSR